MSEDVSLRNIQSMDEEIRKNLLCTALHNSLQQINCIKALTTETENSESYEKLNDIIDEVRGTLEESFEEIRITGTCEKIEGRIAQTAIRNKEENELLENSQIALVDLQKLEQELEMEKSKSYSNEKDKGEEIGKIKDQYEDLVEEYRIKEDYIEKWMNSKYEQFTGMMNQKEYRLKDTVRHSTNEYERELRIHLEMDSYLNTVIQDHSNAIAMWSEKYKTDCCNMDTQIKSIKKTRENIQSRTKEAITLFETRDAEMKKFAILKEKRRLEKLERERIDRQATVIQAWWRGVMVRRKLGPYRPKKSKGKGKGKSGKRK